MTRTATIWADSYSPIFRDWIRRVFRGYRKNWRLPADHPREVLNVTPDAGVIAVHLGDVERQSLIALAAADAVASADSKLIAIGVSPMQCPAAFRIGARGFVLVGELPSMARKRVSDACAGTMSLCDRSVAVLEQYFACHRFDIQESLDRLSKREREVLSLLCGGLSLTQVAPALGVSRHTVITFVRRMSRKVGAHSLLDLARFGYQAGICNGDKPRTAHRIGTT